MHVDALHRHMIMEAQSLHDSVKTFLTPTVPEDYAGRTITLQPFLNRLNRYTLPHRVFNAIKHESGITVEQGKYCAEWLPKHLQDGIKADIRIYWLVDRTYSRRVQVTPAIWKRWHNWFWYYTMHELIHRVQDHHRPEADARVFAVDTEDQKLKEQQTYLSDYDEIEAYSHDIAFEMHMHFPDLSYRAALEAVKRSGPSTPYNTYRMYRRSFAETPNHPTLRALHRKLPKWYASIETYRSFYTDTLQWQA